MGRAMWCKGSRRRLSDGLPVVAEGHAFVIFKIYDSLPDMQDKLDVARALFPPTTVQCARTGPGRVLLTWNLPDVEAKYFLVESKTGAEVFRQMGLSGGGGTSLQFVNQDDAKMYSFRLRSRVDRITSSYSNVAVC